MKLRPLRPKSLLHPTPKLSPQDDDAVSPIIAVILMVAITVVLAAVVYVWVSGFQVGNAPAGSLSLTSNGHPFTDANASFIVSSATPGLSYNGVALQLDGSPLAYANLSASVPSADRWCVWNPAGYCLASQPSGALKAGDNIIVQNPPTTSGSKLTVLDKNANALLLTLSIN